MGQFVIVAYRPFEGKEAQLLELVEEHLPILRGQGLATDRRPLVMRAADGAIGGVIKNTASLIGCIHTNHYCFRFYIVKLSGG